MQALIMNRNNDLDFKMNSQNHVFLWIKLMKNKETSVAIQVKVMKDHSNTMQLFSYNLTNKKVV